MPFHFRMGIEPENHPVPNHPFDHLTRHQLGLICHAIGENGVTDEVDKPRSAVAGGMNGTDGQGGGKWMKLALSFSQSRDRWFQPQLLERGIAQALRFAHNDNDTTAFVVLADQFCIDGFDEINFGARRYREPKVFGDQVDELIGRHTGVVEHRRRLPRPQFSQCMPDNRGLAHADLTGQQTETIASAQAVLQTRLGIAVCGAQETQFVIGHRLKRVGD